MSEQQELIKVSEKRLVLKIAGAAVATGVVAFGTRYAIRLIRKSRADEKYGKDAVTFANSFREKLSAIVVSDNDILNLARRLYTAGMDIDSVIGAYDAIYNDDLIADIENGLSAENYAEFERIINADAPNIPVEDVLPINNDPTQLTAAEKAIGEQLARDIIADIKGITFYYTLEPWQNLANATPRQLLAANAAYPILTSEYPTLRQHLNTEIISAPLYRNLREAIFRNMDNAGITV